MLAMVNLKVQRDIYPPQTGAHWGRCPRLDLKSARLFRSKAKVLPAVMFRKSTRIAPKGGPCGVTEGGHPRREVFGGGERGRTGSGS